MRYRISQFKPLDKIFCDSQSPNFFVWLEMGVFAGHANFISVCFYGINQEYNSPQRNGERGVKTFLIH